MENKDIRPCPFCGGEAKLKKERYFASVVCTKCGAKSKAVGIQIEISAADEAKRLWNRRMIDDRLERPYDAFGDDQGKGNTADEWYSENFVEASAYKGEKNK